MSKFLFMILLSFSSFQVFSQTEYIEIQNNTVCTTYLRLRLSDPAAPCAAAFGSSVIAIPPSTTLNYDYTNYPGSTATSPQYFITADIFYGPVVCSPASVVIGDPCATPNMLSAIGQYTSPICAGMCGQAHVRWDPSVNPSDVAILSIYP